MSKVLVVMFFGIYLTLFIISLPVIRPIRPVLTLPSSMTSRLWSNSFLNNSSSSRLKNSELSLWPRCQQSMRFACSLTTSAMYSLPHAVNTKVDQALHALGPPPSCFACTKIHPAAIAALSLAGRPEVLLGWAFRDGVIKKAVALFQPEVGRVRE